MKNLGVESELYQKRSGIVTTYRLLRQARGITTTRDPVVRFAIMLVAALLEKLWLVLRWAVVAGPRRGGRDLPDEFTFKTFCDWIRHELEEELQPRLPNPFNTVRRDGRIRLPSLTSRLLLIVALLIISTQPAIRT